MPLKLNSTSGGSVTLQEPTTASNRTLTLPDVTTTAVGTDATQTLSNKTFSGAQTFGTASLPEPSGSAPLYLARAWVNFNGTSTVAIRASGNVSSITDRGTGEYTINFTSAMPDANYSVSGIGGNSSTINGVFFEAPVRTAQTTSAVQLAIVSHTGTLTDVDYISAAIFR